MALKKEKKGRHLLVDCWDVDREICLDDKRVLAIMTKAIKDAGFKEFNQVRYKFGHDSPPGFACVVMTLNDGGHLSAHSYADLGLIAIDVFTYRGINPRTIVKDIVSNLGTAKVTVREFKKIQLPSKRS